MRGRSKTRELGWNVRRPGFKSHFFFFSQREKSVAQGQPANRWLTILSSTHDQRTNSVKTGQVIAEKQTLNAPHQRKINEGSSGVETDLLLGSIATEMAFFMTQGPRLGVSFIRGVPGCFRR